MHCVLVGGPRSPSGRGNFLVGTPCDVAFRQNCLATFSLFCIEAMRSFNACADGSYRHRGTTKATTIGTVARWPLENNLNV